MAEQDERTVSMETFKDNYDSPWKEAVEHYFPEFIRVLFSRGLCSDRLVKRACFSGSGTTGSRAGC